MGRITVEVNVANNREIIAAELGQHTPGTVRRMAVPGVIDSGAAKLVLPKRVADALDLKVEGETTVRYADHRREKRPLVSNVWLELHGRHGVFSATIEPDREDALIGAIVLEELDLIVDCGTQSVRLREPDAILVEIE
jgi:predicted aspartyl protease